MAASNFLNTLKKKGVIVPHIENYFARGKFVPFTVEVDPEKEKDTAFHPSSHAVGCPRLIYALMTKELAKPKPTATQQKTWQIGHLYHGLIQHVVVNELGFCPLDGIEREFRGTLDGKVLDCSVDWRTDPEIESALGWMRGHADLVPVEIPGRPEPWLIDIKTAHSFGFLTAGKEDDSLWPKYKAQVELYMDWHGVEQCIILYQNKDAPHDFKEKIVRANPEGCERIYEKWTVVAEAMKAGEPPECECSEPESCPARHLYGVAA